MRCRNIKQFVKAATQLLTLRRNKELLRKHVMQKLLKTLQRGHKKHNKLVKQFQLKIYAMNLGVIKKCLHR
jgi:hypothetical protein